jgi:hypothetical protein
MSINYIEFYDKSTEKLLKAIKSSPVEFKIGTIIKIDGYSWKIEGTILRIETFTKQISYKPRYAREIDRFVQIVQVSKI